MLQFSEEVVAGGQGTKEKRDKIEDILEGEEGEDEEDEEDMEVIFWTCRSISVCHRYRREMTDVDAIFYQHEAPITPRKKKKTVLRVWKIQIFHFGRFFFFFFLIFPKSCKISHFLTKIWKF